MNDLTKLTLSDALTGLDKKQFSSRELTDAFIQAIDAANPSINAYVVQTPEKARAMADDSADERRAKGEAGKLEGAPLLALRTCSAPKACARQRVQHIFGEFTPTYESTVTQNLWNEGRSDARQAQYG